MRKCLVVNCKNPKGNKPFCSKCWLNISIHTRRALSMLPREDKHFRELVETAKEQIYSAIAVRGKPVISEKVVPVAPL